MLLGSLSKSRQENSSLRDDNDDNSRTTEHADSPLGYQRAYRLPLPLPLPAWSGEAAAADEALRGWQTPTRRLLFAAAGRQPSRALQFQFCSIVESIPSHKKTLEKGNVHLSEILTRHEIYNKHSKVTEGGAQPIRTQPV